MHATGYLETRSRHPVALVAAISLNLAAVGVMLAYNPKIIGIEPDKTKWIDIRPPEPIKPIEPIKRQPTKSSETPQRPTPIPTASKPVIDDFPVERTVTWQDPPLPPLPPLPPGPETTVKPDPVERGAAVDPRFADQLQPAYPPALERLEIEGRATVKVQVGTDGRVMAVELVRADDPGFFNATRDQALKRWRFKPATRDGVPVVSWVTKTVVFTIRR